MSLVRYGRATRGYGYKYLSGSFVDDRYSIRHDTKMLHLMENSVLIVSANGPDINMFLFEVSSEGLKPLQEYSFRPNFGVGIGDLKILDVVNTRFAGMSAASFVAAPYRFAVIVDNGKFSLILNVVINLSIVAEHTIYAFKGYYDSKSKFHVDSEFKKIKSYSYAPPKQGSFFVNVSVCIWLIRRIIFNTFCRLVPWLMTSLLLQ